MRTWTLPLIALLSSSSANALASEPRTDPPSEAAAEPAPAEGAPAEAAPAEMPPGFADLAPEVQKAINEMDEAALQALMDKSQQGQTLDAREQAIVDGVIHISMAKFEASFSYQTGDVAIGDGMATLHLGTGFRYLGPEDTHRLLVEGWGNPPGQVTLGMIVPA
ncbi:MAG TPA: DUF2167 domain-containing protein, partial [Haliangium sp.]|nr:DUF2167 domain-containing protein [Haliangium sp.]